jgi:hypothetical protein
MNNQFGQGTGVQRPAELDDRNADPKTRATVLDAYVAHVTERPQSEWSEAERNSVREHINAVLKGMGR